MTTNRPLRVFLCHSSIDKPAVRELYQKLRAEPWIQPWLDEEELFPGMDWNMEIEKAVEAADAIIVCLSQGSITKEGYVQKEIKTALDFSDYKPEGTVFIIPIRLEDCKPPIRLSKWQYADYFEGQRERGVERLLVSLRKRAESLSLHFEKPKLGRDDVMNFLDQVDIGYLNREKEKTTGANDAGVIENSNKLTLSNGMEFMRVSMGKFLMGSTRESWQAHDDERPQQPIYIPYNYWMARFPITNEQYNQFVLSKGLKHPVSDWTWGKDHPVVHVNWNDAMAYCQWLNSSIKSEWRFGLILRLPTEAEWEKSARWLSSSVEDGFGGEGESLEYPWGNEFDKNKCNSSEGGMGTTTPVGAYSPQGDSPCGCADMAGNVLEWTHSLHKDYPYIASDGREDEKVQGFRIARGGSCFGNGDMCRCAFRDSYDEGYLSQFSGFRICLAPPLPK